MSSQQPTRRWPQFSLLTLMLGVVLCSAGYGLWYRWEPWVLLESPKKKLWR